MTEEQYYFLLLKLLPYEEHVGRMLHFCSYDLLRKYPNIKRVLSNEEYLSDVYWGSKYCREIVEKPIEYLKQLKPRKRFKHLQRCGVTHIISGGGVDRFLKIDSSGTTELFVCEPRESISLLYFKHVFDTDPKTFHSRYKQIHETLYQIVILSYCNYETILQELSDIPSYEVSYYIGENPLLTNAQRINILIRCK